MIEAQKASFKFTKFKVPEFSYLESNNQEVDLKLNFNPSGNYFQEEGKFELIINFTGSEDKDNNKKIIKVIGIAEFKFSSNLDFSEIPDYFYKNSIPIVFPYLRSFISTLTMQANTGVIMLGLINFTNMAETLKSNTTLIK